MADVAGSHAISLSPALQPSDIHVPHLMSSVSTKPVLLILRPWMWCFWRKLTVCKHYVPCDWPTLIDHEARCICRSEQARYNAKTCKIIMEVHTLSTSFCASSSAWAGISPLPSQGWSRVVEMKLSNPQTQRWMSDNTFVFTLFCVEYGVFVTISAW